MSGSRTIQTMNFGARQLVQNCLQLRTGENTVIVADRSTSHLAQLIEGQASALGINSSIFVMEDFGGRPEDGSNPLKFPREIDSAMRGAQASIFLARMVEGERVSFRDPMTELAELLKLRHAHMPGFTDEMMTQGMAADYRTVQELAKKVHAIVSRARQISITTPAGTDVTIHFDPNRPWIVCDGIIKPGQVRNLPDGEVLLGDEICPDTCRFWDAKTRKKLDKDRFRQDLGGVEDAYREIARRVEG